METLAHTSTLGTNIRTLRENMGLSQQQLAEYLGISRGEVSYFENESRKPNLVVLEKLANLFGIDMADLLTPDAAAQALHSEFAFRASDMQAAQLEQIASFRRIVSNSMKMTNLLNREE